jgi:hypothetical protein
MTKPLTPFNLITPLGMREAVNLRDTLSLLIAEEEKSKKSKKSAKRK